MPSHDMTRFYALIPAFAVLFALSPAAFAAVTGAISTVEALSRWHGRR